MPLGPWVFVQADMNGDVFYLVESSLEFFGQIFLPIDELSLGH